MLFASVEITKAHPNKLLARLVDTLVREYIAQKRGQHHGNHIHGNYIGQCERCTEYVPKAISGCSSHCQ